MSTKSVESVPQHLLMTNVAIRHLSFDNSRLLLSEVFIIQSLVYISWYQLWTFDQVYSHKYTVGISAKKTYEKSNIIKHLPPTRPNIRKTIPNVMLKNSYKISVIFDESFKVMPIKNVLLTINVLLTTNVLLTIKQGHRIRRHL